MLRYQLHHVLPFSPEQLFDLAADVEQYPDYLPWWIAARVVKHEGRAYYTDQIVAFGLIRRRFTTKTILWRPERIDVTSIDRSVRRFDLSWAFASAPEGGCRVTLAVNLALRPKLLEILFRQALAGGVDRILVAFEMRARRLYGGVSGTTCAAESDSIGGNDCKTAPR